MNPLPHESSEFSFQINIPFNDSPWLPIVRDQKFGRVTVFLGANGSGKSRLLRSLADHPVVNEERRKLVYIEGGRAITFKGVKAEVGVVQLGQKPAIGVEDDVKESYRNARLLQQRIDSMFSCIEHLDSIKQQAILHQIVDGLKGQPQENVPTSTDWENTAATRLVKEFSQLFPGRRITRSDGRGWRCENGADTYDLEGLSDGETQVLTVLGDVGELSTSRPFVIVDEPELNLHPSLAVDLWNLVERKIPEALFVYATHSLSFAMRPTVTNIVILKGGQQEPIFLARPFDWSITDLSAFLGAIPAVITSSRILVVEGNVSSFDQQFYSWLNGPTVKVTGVGSCNDVYAAIKRQGIWQQTGDAKICGVIDRDFRSVEEIAQIEKRGCFVLNYHEAESYFCHPSVLCDAAQKRDILISIDDLTELLSSICGSLRVEVAKQRTFARSQIRLAPSTRGRGGVQTYDQVKDEIREEFKQEYEKADKLKAYGEQFFEEEFELCTQAIHKQNVEQMLAIFPGKELLKQLSHHVGFKSSSQLISFIIENLSPAEHRPLQNLVSTFQKRWA